VTVSELVQNWIKVENSVQCIDNCWFIGFLEEWSRTCLRNCLVQSKNDSILLVANNEFKKLGCFELGWKIVCFIERDKLNSFEQVGS
jgi:hypothetical protein